MLLDKVYMKTTASTTLTSSTVATEETGATLTYDATPTLTYATGTWQCVVLSTPFIYSGSNLEIIVETNFTGGGSTEGSAGKVMRYSTATSAHQYWEQDTTNPNATLSGTVTSNRPNVQFNYAPPVVAPGVLQFNPTSYTNNEGALVATTVTRTAGTTGAVSVDYATSSSTGAVGGEPATELTITFRHRER